MEVTAETLLEAIAQGQEWVAGITRGAITVLVADVGVEHEVKMAELTN